MMQRVVNSLLRWLGRFYRPEDDERDILRAEAAARLARYGPGANRLTRRPPPPDTHERKAP